jgi:hypothetical protein
LIVPVGQSPWPERIVAIVSIDLAKREDVAVSLSTAKWDLIVIDEAHQLATPSGRRLLRGLVTSAIRLLLETATPEDLSPNVIDGFAKTIWDSKNMTDWNNRPLFVQSQWHLIWYERSPEEIALIDLLRQSYPDLNKASPDNSSL